MFLMTRDHDMTLRLTHVILPVRLPTVLWLILVFISSVLLPHWLLSVTWAESRALIGPGFLRRGVKAACPSHPGRSNTRVFNEVMNFSCYCCLSFVNSCYPGFTVLRCFLRMYQQPILFLAFLCVVYSCYLLGGIIFWLQELVRWLLTSLSAAQYNEPFNYFTPAR